MVIGNNGMIRDINSKLVLETLIEKQPISRAALSKELGLTKATISAIVLELINQKIVQEIGSEDTSMGRKPILLSIDKKCGYIISIDIGVSTISGMVTDLLCEDCYVKQISFPKSTGNFLTIITTFIDSLKTPQDTYYGLIGISLGIHGVTHQNGIVFTPYYHLTGLNLATSLGDYYQVPIYIENEANLSVIGEDTFSDGYQNMANLSIHSGIGLGLIIDYKLYTGYSGYAGELGHTIVEMNGRPCPCGSKGCLEQYLSDQTQLSSEDFIYYLSICVHNIVNMINPEIIIINCSLINQQPELLTAVYEKLTPRIRERVQLLPSKLKDKSILYGGVCVCIKDFLSISKVKLVQKQLSCE